LEAGIVRQVVNQRLLIDRSCSRYGSASGARASTQRSRRAFPHWRFLTGASIAMREGEVREDSEDIIADETHEIGAVNKVANLIGHLNLSER
jgi:hypothetical protein